MITQEQEKKTVYLPWIHTYPIHLDLEYENAFSYEINPLVSCSTKRILPRFIDKLIFDSFSVLFFHTCEQASFFLESNIHF